MGCCDIIVILCSVLQQPIIFPWGGKACIGANTTDWPYIACKAGRVSAVNLTGLGVTGDLSPLKNLTVVEQLLFSSNNFAGRFAAEKYVTCSLMCKFYCNLWLSCRCDCSINIPASQISCAPGPARQLDALQLGNLRALDMGHNSLTGAPSIRLALQTFSEMHEENDYLCLRHCRVGTNLPWV